MSNRFSTTQKSAIEVESLWGVVSLLLATVVTAAFTSSLAMEALSSAESFAAVGSSTTSDLASYATGEGKAVACITLEIWISVTVKVEKEVAVVVKTTLGASALGMTVN